MRILLSKFFYLIVFLTMSYYGFKGLLINYYGSQKKTIVINDSLTLSSLRKYNRIQLKEGEAINKAFYYSGENNYVQVLYPLTDKTGYNSYNNGDTLMVNVLIKNEEVDQRCLESFCIPGNNHNLTGVVFKAAEYLSEYEKEEYLNERIKLAPDAIVVNVSEKQRSLWINLMLFLPVFGAIAIVSSFFVKAKSIDEWYAKVTHQEETKDIIS